MDVEKGSLWLRTTPSSATRSLPFYCTEAGIFYARSNFVTSRTNKDSYLLFFTLGGRGIVIQNQETVFLEAGQALLLDCRTPQSYGTSPGSEKWVHCWIHLNGEGVKALFPLINASSHMNVINVPRDSFSSQFDIFLNNLESDNTELIMQLNVLESQ
jgi:hypothetical protein